MYKAFCNPPCSLSEASNVTERYLNWNKYVLHGCSSNSSLPAVESIAAEAGRRLRKRKRRRSEHCWWKVTTWVNFIGGTSMTSVGDMRRRWRHRQRSDSPSKLPWAWALINWRWSKIVSTQLLLDMLLGLLQHAETVTEISVSKMARHDFCDSCRPYSHSMCKPNGSLGRTAVCAGVGTKNWRDLLLRSRFSPKINKELDLRDSHSSQFISQSIYNIGKKSPQKQGLQTMQAVSDFRPRANSQVL